MNDPIFTKAELAMSKRQFLNHLSDLKMKGHISPGDFGRIYDAHAERRREMKIAKLSSKQRQRWWQRLLKPLKYEEHSVRAGIRFIKTQGRDEPEKEAFLRAYLRVLEALHKKLYLAEVSGETTPRELAREINATYRLKGWETDRVPNDGEHWTDWVPRSQQLPIFDLLSKIPYRKHATVREPFKRTMPPDMAREARVAMKEMLMDKYIKLGWLLETKAAQNPETKMARDAVEKTKKNRERVKAALDALERLKPNAFVPHTTGWPRLLGETPSDDEDEDADD